VFWGREFLTPGTWKPEITWAIRSKGRLLAIDSIEGAISEFRFQSGKGTTIEGLFKSQKLGRVTGGRNPCKRPRTVEKTGGMYLFPGSVNTC
jgi:hypothetical protein